MKTHHKRTGKKNKIRNTGLLFFSVTSVFWFLFRTGTKPSRIVYPCQRAALANSSMIVSAFIPFSITAVLTKTEKFLSKKGSTLALLMLVVSAVIGGEQLLVSLQPVGAVDPRKEIALTLTPRNATVFPASDVYVVNGRESSHISELINLMGSHDLLFYESDTSGANQGPSGLIALEDVVLIKINEEWPARGGTNTDVLNELIQAIVDHPDGFVGEIVVADNGQWQGSMDWPNSNAEDATQSTQDVVNMFVPHYNISTHSWIPIRSKRVSEYSSGDMFDGYILYDNADPETGIYVSYPKFRTQFGTYISFKNGIWNGTGYEKRLKVINMPVLKSHGGYGVTAALKHYMGVQSQSLANGHSKVATGGMGTLMVETGLPTLNIIDAIWINANPPPSSLAGPGTTYDQATRVNVLMAGTDPVALDYWAAKHVLVQAASTIGYDDTHTIDPDNTDRNGLAEAFGLWLSLTKNEIVAGGYIATTDENYMNVYVYPQAPGDYLSPSIGVPSCEPGGDVMPDQPVTVSVTVTDAASGVKNVTLIYTDDNGSSWFDVPMAYNSTMGLFEATLLGQHAGTWIKYRIVAFDNAENQAVNDNAGQYYAYLVIPEFPQAPILLLLFMVLAIVAVLLGKRALQTPKQNRARAHVQLEKKYIRSRAIQYKWTQWSTHPENKSIVVPNISKSEGYAWSLRQM